MSANVRMFVNGQAMRGGSLHHALSDAGFRGEDITAFGGWRAFKAADK